jgi:hypothetical protein
MIQQLLYGNFADLIDRDQKARAMSYALWYGLFLFVTPQ